MKSFWLIGFFVIQWGMPTRCQEVLVDPTRVFENSNNILFELKPRPMHPNAQYHYIVDDYSQGSIFLSGRLIVEDMPMRYDIMRNRMEVRFQDDIKVLYASKIDSFFWYDTDQARAAKFVRASSLEPSQADIKGFLEILAEGPLTLYSYTYLKVYPATSSVALSGTHRAHNVFKREDFFFRSHGGIHSFPKKRKQALQLMMDHLLEVKTFIRRNGLLLSRKQDIIQLIQYYNSL